MKVKAHSEIKENEQADVLAKKRVSNKIILLQLQNTDRHFNMYSPNWHNTKVNILIKTLINTHNMLYYQAS